jgi:hypothetical protein
MDSSFSFMAVVKVFVQSGDSSVNVMRRNINRERETDTNTQTKCFFAIPIPFFF